MSISSFTGQRLIVSQLKDEIDASKALHKPVPHLTLHSPPGMGKDTLVRVLADERGVKLFPVMASQLTDVELTRVLGEIAKRNLGAYDQRGFLIDKSKIVPDIIYINESDRISREVGYIIHDIMDERPDGRRLFRAKRPGIGTPQPAYAPMLTFILATNLLGALKKKAAALVNRTTVFSMEPYDEKHLIQMLHDRLMKDEIIASDGVLEMIASRSIGIPRTALRLLDRCMTKMYAMLSRKEVREKKIKVSMVQEVFKTLRIDDLGLDENARNYLLALAKSPSAKMGAEALSSTIGVDKETLTVDIEPFLLKSGLVQVVAGGRQITQKGMEHIGLAEADPVAQIILPPAT